MSDYTLDDELFFSSTILFFSRHSITSLFWFHLWKDSHSRAGQAFSSQGRGRGKEEEGVPQSILHNNTQSQQYNII